MIEIQVAQFSRSEFQGFALPWELEYYSNYLTRTKRGDVDGFASGNKIRNLIQEIILVEELKLGIVVLVNTVEEASAIAVAVSEIVIPVFTQVLQSLQNEINNLPPNYNSYIGTYGGKYLIIV